MSDFKLGDKIGQRSIAITAGLAALMLASCAPGMFPFQRQGSMNNQAAMNRNVAEVSSERVREAQAMLRDLNYDPGQIDGLLGPETRGAVRDFQYDHGFQITGQIGERTFDSIRAEAQRVASARQGRIASSAAAPANPQQVQAPAAQKRFATELSTESIKNIQMRLNENGFDAGHVDGVMGPQTRTAIRNFQRQKQLEITGRVDERTADALGAEIADRTASQADRQQPQQRQPANGERKGRDVARNQPDAPKGEAR